jgi:hypothetical protein
MDITGTLPGLQDPRPIPTFAFEPKVARSSVGMRLDRMATECEVHLPTAKRSTNTCAATVEPHGVPQNAVTVSN